MLADPEAYLNIIQGPDGEFWYSDDQGNAYLTEAGTKWFEDGHNDSSGFTLSNGETLEMWNSPFLARNGTLTRFGDGKGRLPHRFHSGLDRVQRDRHFFQGVRPVACNHRPRELEGMAGR